MITEQVAGRPEQPQPTTRVSRLQLAVIGAVVVLAAGIGLVLGLTVLSGRGATALGPSAAYVPSDAVLYMEARLDLPAGQRESLRAILERFPSVDPDTVLGEAVADTLDDALAAALGPVASISYSADVAPWFDGRVAISLLDYPINADPMSMALPSTAALFGVRDVAAADAFADKVRTALETSGATWTSSVHAGVTVWTLEADAMVPMPVSGAGFAYALTGDQLLLANGRETVEALLDVHAGTGESLAQRDELGALSEHLPADWAGVMTLDLAAMLEETRAQLEAASPEMAQALSAYLDAIPSFVVTTVGFENDAVRFDGVSTMPGGDLTPSNGNRALAASVPGDALFFADGPNVGPGLVQAITGIRATLAAAPDGGMMDQQLTQVEAALGADLDDFVSWIGSGAMAAGWDGEQPWFGLVLEAADADAAAQRLGQLRALVELAAMDPATQVEVSTEDVGGVEVTTVSTTVEPQGGVLPFSGVAVQYALDGGTAFIGFGDRFVEAALGMEAGASLAESERFMSAVDRFGGADNAGAFYLDLAALRVTVEGAVPEIHATPVYESEIRPNLTPLDYLAGVTRVEGDEVVSRFGLVLTP
jgi:hypothetical protein